MSWLTRDFTHNTSQSCNKSSNSQGWGVLKAAPHNAVVKAAPHNAVVKATPYNAVVQAALHNAVVKATPYNAPDLPNIMIYPIS